MLVSSWYHWINSALTLEWFVQERKKLSLKKLSEFQPQFAETVFRLILTVFLGRKLFSP